MEPKFDTLTLHAGEFSGGVGHKEFKAHERWSADSGISWGQTSASREVISVAGLDVPGNAAAVEFSLEEGFFSTGERSREHVIRLCGMWDNYRNLDHECAIIAKIMPTFGTFRIILNDKPIYNDRVYYWNIRQWRFWPTWELGVDENVFNKGHNRLTVENLTPPFLENIPDYLTAVLDMEEVATASNRLPRTTLHDTTFNLSNIDILTRSYSDFEVINSPSVVNVGEPFVVEVYATRAYQLAFQLDETTTVLSESALSVGRNRLRFTVDRPATNVSIAATSMEGSGSFRALVNQAIALDHQNDFLLGHMIGGHNSAFPVTADVLRDNYRRLIEVFIDTGQGNLLGWLTEPRKAAEWVCDTLPVDEIVRSRLNVCFRYNGNYHPEDPYPSDLRKCIEELGDSFVGFAPHEYGNLMAKSVAQSADRDKAFRAFCSTVQGYLDRCKGVSAESRAWVTDPSLYSNVYRSLGADLAGLELFPLHCNLNISSARGAGRSCGDKKWAAINSFECQAYGGLAMREPMQRLDCRFDEKRANLWWFSLFHLYLSGSRIMYSESGAFHQAVTKQLNMEDSQLVALRQSQRELFEFSRIHSLQGQPQASFAFVKPHDDIFTDTYAPPIDQAVESDYSWERVRVAFPQVRWRNEKLRGMTNTINDRSYYSDSPFGEVDIITTDVPLEVLCGYRAVVLVGNHRLSEPQAKLIGEYVTNCGRVILGLADFLDEAGNLVSPDALTDLCGIELDAQIESSFLWEVESTDSKLGAKLESSFIRCFESSGAYHGAVLGKIELRSSAVPVLRDRFSKEPFIVKNGIGAGAVWFVNCVHYHANREYQLLLNQFVSAIFDETQVPLKLTEGRSINHFVYEHESNGRMFYQVLVLNNDWFSENAEHCVSFDYEAISFSLSVRRNEVRQFFLFGNMVVVTQNHTTRFDDALWNDEGKLEIKLQGIGEEELMFYGADHLRKAELFGPGGRGQAGGILPMDGHRVRLTLSGLHTLSLSYAPAKES